MIQDDIFITDEGNQWFKRNRDAIVDQDRFDWPSKIVESLKGKAEIGRILELGCANGWRLARIKDMFQRSVELYGSDASAEAIADGTSRYSDLRLKQGLLSEISFDLMFDLVIVNFVFHWVDRKSLTKSIAEIDRVICDQGLLIVGDFLPDFPQKRPYHHLPGQNVFTYKQDYANIFKSLGTYSEIFRVTFNHDRPNQYLGGNPSDERGCCCLLRKSLDGYYLET